MHQLKTPEIFLFHLHAYLLEIFDQNLKKTLICGFIEVGTKSSFGTP